MKLNRYLTFFLILHLLFNSGHLIAQIKKTFFEEFEERGKQFGKSYDKMSEVEKKAYRNYRNWANYWSYTIPPDMCIADYKKIQRDINQQFISSAHDKSTTGLEWTEIGPNVWPSGNPDHGIGIGRIVYIAFDTVDSLKMLACSPLGGLFRSEDGGGSWFNAGTDKYLPETGVSCAIIDPNDPDSVWYVSSGNAHLPFWSTLVKQESSGIYRTTNGGATWENIGLSLPQLNTAPEWQINKILQIPGERQHLIAATTEGIYETFNSLSSSPSWNRILKLDGCFFDLQLKPGTSNMIYCSTQHETSPKVYEYNLANNFSRVLMEVQPTIPVTDLKRISLRFSNSSPDQLYIAFCDDYFDSTVAIGALSKLYRYNLSINGTYDKGYFGKLQCSFAESFYVSHANANILYYGNVRPYYKSTNGLIDYVDCNWTAFSQEIHDDTHFITENPTGHQLWIATDGGLYVSTNGRDTFEQKNNGLGVSQVYFFDVSEIGPEKIISGYQDVGIISLQKNQLDKWDANYEFACDGWSSFFDYRDSGISYAQKQGSMLFRNDGLGWVRADNPGPYDGDYFYCLNSKNSNIVYSTTVRGIYKSTDKGKPGTWNSSPWASFPGNLYPKAYHISTSPTNPDYLYVCLDEESRIVKSVNGGGPNSSDWTVIGNNPSAPELRLQEMEVDYNNPDHIWVVGKSPTKKKTYVYSVNTITDTWDTISRNGLSIYTLIGQVISEHNSNNGLYISSNTGIYYRDASLSEWVNVTGELPNTHVYSMDINHTTKEIYIGTHGRGIWSAPLYCAAQGNDLTLTGTLSNISKHYNHNITSNSTTVMQNKNMLRAGNEIIFNPGFETYTGSELIAYVNPCNSEGILQKSMQNKEISMEVKGTTLADSSLSINKPEYMIYPNPTSDELFIELTGDDIQSNLVEVYNSQGLVIYKNSSSQSYVVRMLDIPKGLYLVKISLNEKVFIEPVILQ
jgi:hypothetical protein